MNPNLKWLRIGRKISPLNLISWINLRKLTLPTYRPKRIRDAESKEHPVEIGVGT